MSILLWSAVSWSVPGRISEDGYVPVRAHFDSILRRMYAATLGDGGGACNCT